MQQHQLLAAAHLSRISAFLSASVLSDVRLSKGEVDLQTSCSTCAAPRHVSSFRSMKARRRRSKRNKHQGPVKSQLVAQCGLCASQDALGQWDKAAWNTSSQPSTATVRPLTASSSSSSSVPLQTSTARIQTKPETSDPATSATPSKKRRKKSKHEGLQALLEKSKAAETDHQVDKTKQSTSGLSSLFAQLI